MILISQSKYENNTNCTGLNCCLVTGSVVKPFGQPFNGRRHQTPEKPHTNAFLLRSETTANTVQACVTAIQT